MSMSDASTAQCDKSKTTRGESKTTGEKSKTKGSRSKTKGSRSKTKGNESTTKGSEDVDFFRCPVQAEQSQGVIRVGRSRISTTVQETSIDGFTVLVEHHLASKLKVGRPWILEHEETRVEVHPQWFFNAPEGRAQIGLRRLRDLTRPMKERRSLLTRYGGGRYDDPSVSAAVYGGFVLFLFSLLALPGLGDRLGTATRIQNGFRWVVEGIDESIRPYL